MNKLAVLITSFNRKENTLACIQSIYDQVNPNVEYKIFLTIDGSTDGTHTAVEATFPEVQLFFGDGNLFWAGGMRFCFDRIKQSGGEFDYYLLLNDDTVLFNNAFNGLLKDFQSLPSKESIIVGSTQGKNARLENNFTYGGKILLNKYNSKSKFVLPNKKTPQICHLGNANIMLIPNLVIKRIGFLSTQFTHGIADYEYTLRARKNKINSYISSDYLGICHIGDNQIYTWKSTTKSTLKERIDYLHSVKGLAYKEYMIYIKKYFPYYYPQSFIMLWAKTLFPVFWEKFKKR